MWARESRKQSVPTASAESENKSRKTTNNKTRSSKVPIAQLCVVQLGKLVACGFFLAVLGIPPCLISAGNRSDMTLDVLCPGLLPLLFASQSHCGQNMTLAALQLPVGAL